MELELGICRRRGGDSCACSFLTVSLQCPTFNTQDLTFAVLSIIGVFLQWYSSPGDLPMLFGGKVLTGIPLGGKSSSHSVLCRASQDLSIYHHRTNILR